MRGAERLMNCTPVNDKKLHVQGSPPTVGSYLIYVFSGTLFIRFARTGVFCVDISEPLTFSIQSSACLDAEA